MKWAILFCGIAAMAWADNVDAPNYLRQLAGQRDVAAINENDRALSDAIRKTDLTRGGIVDGDLNINGSIIGGNLPSLSGNNLWTGNEGHTGPETFVGSMTAAAFSCSSCSIILGTNVGTMSGGLAVSSLTVTNALYANLAPKAFVTFVGNGTSAGSQSVLFSVNVASVTRTAAGNFNIHFITPFVSTLTYVCEGSCADHTANNLAFGPNDSDKGEGSLSVHTFPAVCSTGGGGDTAADIVRVICFGQQ